MTKRTEETLLRILDLHASGEVVSYKKLAKAVGVSWRSIFSWLSDSSIMVTWNGERTTFRAAMLSARLAMKAAVVSDSLEEVVAGGRKIAVWHHGVQTFEPCELAHSCATDAELQEYIDLGLCWPDKLKRVFNAATGVYERVPSFRSEPASAEMIIAFARANQPALYGNKLETTIKGSMSLGVRTIGAQKPLPAYVLEAMDRPPATEVITETVLVDDSAPVEVFEVEPDPLDDLLGPEPEPAPIGAATDTPPVPFDPEPAPPLEPLPVAPGRTSETMISTPTPPEYAPPPAPILATARTIPPGWRAEIEALQRKLALPEKLDRR